MENGTYTVVPEERCLIEQIFTRYLDGASLQQLSIMAEETGLKFRENASSWNPKIWYPEFWTTAGIGTENSIRRLWRGRLLRK